MKQQNSQQNDQFEGRTLARTIFVFKCEFSIVGKKSQHPALIVLSTQRLSFFNLYLKECETCPIEKVCWNPILQKDEKIKDIKTIIDCVLQQFLAIVIETEEGYIVKEKKDSTFLIFFEDSTTKREVMSKLIELLKNHQAYPFKMNNYFISKLSTKKRELKGLGNLSGLKTF